MSKKNTLNKTDWKSIGRGALVAVIGTLLTYGTQQIGNIDFGEYTPIVVTLLSVITNIVRKYLTETK